MGWEDGEIGLCGSNQILWMTVWTRGAPKLGPPTRIHLRVLVGTKGRKLCWEGAEWILR